MPKKTYTQVVAAPFRVSMVCIIISFNELICIDLDAKYIYTTFFSMVIYFCFIYFPNFCLWTLFFLYVGFFRRWSQWKGSYFVVCQGWQKGLCLVLFDTRKGWATTLERYFRWRRRSYIYCQGQQVRYFYIYLIIYLYGIYYCQFFFTNRFSF